MDAKKSLFKCAYAVYRATDSISDARRDIEKKERDKAVKMLMKAVEGMMDVKEECGIETEETALILDEVKNLVRFEDWEEANRLIKMAEDDFEHKLLKTASDCQKLK